MDFDLFRSILGQLDTPEIIRLNYSGESAHYPQLLEAIRLAGQSGAFTELVSALASYPRNLIGQLVESGLDRLTVSLHTLDEAQFQRIYRFAGVAQMRQALRTFRESQRHLATTKPMLDFAFVAMQENLDQLGPVAEYARELGVRQISVHPVIRRAEIPLDMSQELVDNRLRPQFKRELGSAIDAARTRVPAVQITLSTEELEPDGALDGTPRRYCGALPPGAEIFSCDQNPWETIHILASGDVVACEVLDQAPLGNLRRSTLREIWQGSAYRAFRENYRAGKVPECRTCPYKLAYLPGPMASVISGRLAGNVQLQSGWHPYDGELTWSKRDSSAILAAGPAARSLRMEGILPPSPDGSETTLFIRGNGRTLGSVSNSSAAHKPFQLGMALDITDLQLRLEFRMSRIYRPCDAGSPDVRELGFALLQAEVSEAEVSPEAPPAGPASASQPPDSQERLWPQARKWLERARTRLRPWLARDAGACWRSLLPAGLERIRTRVQNGLLAMALASSEGLSRLFSRFPRNLRVRAGWQPGITVIIPERSTPGLLGKCLQAAQDAAEGLKEPVEFIVVVNGSSLDPYRELARKFPGVNWLRSKRPLSFQSAISKGLRRARHDWVYLLNSDMMLESGALTEAAKWRDDHVFAIASQIFFADSSRRREETGWTNFRAGSREGIEIFDQISENSDCVRGHLYAGGGSSLFRRDLLRRVMTRSDPYAPFYWEDVEWGVRAWRSGYEVLFCPRSRASHVHRATVSQFYDPEEVSRIFRRNARLFDLRNRLSGDSPAALARRTRGADPRTRAEICSLRGLVSLLSGWCWNARTAWGNEVLRLAAGKYYLQPTARRAKRPRVLVVSPFGILPPAHGGARRITGLVKHLAAGFDIVLLSDEESLYTSQAVESCQELLCVHLVGGRPAGSTLSDDRIRRIQSHSHGLLRREVRRIAESYRIDLVQVEHIELAGLVQERAGSAPWFITLHDVLLNGSPHSAEDEFELELLRKHSAVLVCSPEDADLLPQLAPGLVPNGLESGRPPAGSSRGNRSILFAGPFRYPPNLEGIHRFLTSVYPRLLQALPDLRLEILGGCGAREAARSLDGFQQQGVHVHDQVESVQEFYQSCALAINPLSGIRGSSIKLLESLAAGRVCVSTREGARGVGRLPVPSLIVVERVEDFIGPLQALLLDEDRRLSIERPDPALLASLDWRASAAAQRALYLEHLGRR